MIENGHICLHVFFPYFLSPLSSNFLKSLYISLLSSLSPTFSPFPLSPNDRHNGKTKKDFKKMKDMGEKEKKKREKNSCKHKRSLLAT